VGPANLDRSNLYRDLFKDGTNDGQLGFGFPKASNHTPFNGFRIGFFHVSCIQMQNTEYMIDDLTFILAPISMQKNDSIHSDYLNSEVLRLST
jgi:hypothetical protein